MPRRIRRARVLSLICSLIAFPALAFPEQTFKTTGPCSPVAPQNKGIFVIRCSGVSDKLGHQLVNILNRIKERQLDPRVVMEKLDEIQKGVSNITGELNAQREEQEEKERIRRTAPKLDAYLEVQGKGKVNLEIKSRNLIPFEYRYVVVTEKNLVVAPLPITMSKVYPDKDHDLFFLPISLQLDRIKDHYLELRFTFESLSFDQFHLPGHEGEIIKKYRIGPNGNSLTPISSSPLVNGVSAHPTR